MNPGKTFWNWLINKEDKREVIGIPLSPEDQHKFKAILSENSTLKAQIGLLLADIKNKQEEEKRKDHDTELKKELKEQELESTKENYGDNVSFLTIFKEILGNKKFRDNLELVDIHDKANFGVFGDLRIIKTGQYAGYWLITDTHNNPVKIGRNIRDVIYRPETLGVQLKRGRIILPVDKDMKPVLYGIEDMEINDVRFNEEYGEFEEMEEYRDKFKILLQEKLKEIREKSEYIERCEFTITKQTRDINDLKRSLATLKNQSNTSQSELSQVTSLNMQYGANIGAMQRKISSLTEAKVLYENLLDKKDEIINKILAKLELYGDKTVYEQTKAEVQQDLELYKTLLPETITQMLPPEEKTVPIRNPGDNLGMTGKVK